MKLAVALVLALAALAAPALARADPASIVTRDLPVAGARSLAGATGTPRFTLVGFHWRGAGTVSFRTRTIGGRWSAWHAAAPEQEDGPDRASREGILRRDGWRLGNPYWTGPSDGIEYRVRGRVTRLRVHLVRSDPEPWPLRTLSLAGAPPIVPRLSWGANELLKRAPPSYAEATKFAIVHHTAGSNTYTRAQAAAIVKAIQLYHVRGNGWNDIGYNLLVDKYGQVFEGRFGGMDRNVVGAHAQGFNTGSVGVAVLGNYGGTALTPAARDALVRVLAWRLDLAHVDPLSTLNWISGGNPRFPRGVPVFLRAVAGHRDTGFTACPGDSIYAGLGELARAVAVTGAPKVFAPTVRGTLGGPVRFGARLSSALPWTIRVTDAARATVASGTGVGTAVNWTWDATYAAAGPYAWSISVPGARPATGVLGRRAAALTLTRVRVEPAAVTPNGDGVDDTATISYTLGAPATVTATLTDPTGLMLTTLVSEPRPAGPQSFQFTAENLLDGSYGILLTASGPNGRTVTASTTVFVNRTLAGLAVSQKVFSPNGDGRRDTLTFAFSLGAPADVKLRILRAGRWVATPFAGPLAAGPQAFTWDGEKRLGRLLDGTYEAEVSAASETGTIAQRVPFAADSTPPVLRLLSRRPLRFRLSEPAEVVLVLGRAKQVVRRLQAGPFTVPLPAAQRRLRAVAWDAAGNTSRPVRRR
jgi:N-acetylmuramoyl-L-alanine amidase